MVVGDIASALRRPPLSDLVGKVSLIFTSPPFPLVRKKRYGNESGTKYMKWLKSIAPRLADLLTPDGSIVVEIGNAWEQGDPVMSTLPIEALLAFKKAGRLKLCQYLICHNPARLPSPAQWVTIERKRLKDSFTHVWWLARTKDPKADNRRVLVPYSESMKQLLSSRNYNPGRRPSGHVISKSGFLVDHGGAIAASVIPTNGEGRLPASLITLSNTRSDTRYMAYCRKRRLEPHPARMPSAMAGFFISMLTDPDEMVLDPFAGSNTTGAAAEALGRRWTAVEALLEYAEGSKGRFARIRLSKRGR
jgi:site-specific DNA-methyltransferase (cytosine-N4-specific)